MYTIYQVTNSINGKSYVGFTIDSMETRWTKHKSTASKCAKTYFHKAIKKYGSENFVLSILKQGEDHEWGLKVEEPYHIGIYKTNDPLWGYNLTEGGDGILGYKHTEEYKKSLKGNQNCKGKKNALGHKQTKEWCERQSKRLKGVPHSDEHSQNISKALKGNQNCKGKQNALGCKHTEEQRRAKSERQLGIPQKLVTCPHCNKTGGMLSMGRWHFDTCKKKGAL
jgi:group I intron endonuclease